MTFHQILNPHPPFAPFGEEVEVELMSSVVVDDDLESDALVTAIDEDKVLLVC
jgi:hypothetical protein